MLSSAVSSATRDTAPVRRADAAALRSAERLRHGASAAKSASTKRDYAAGVMRHASFAPAVGKRYARYSQHAKCMRAHFLGLAPANFWVASLLSRSSSRLLLILLLTPQPCRASSSRRPTRRRRPRSRCARARQCTHASVALAAAPRLRARGSGFANSRARSAPFWLRAREQRRFQRMLTRRARPPSRPRTLPQSRRRAPRRLPRRPATPRSSRRRAWARRAAPAPRCAAAMHFCRRASLTRRRAGAENQPHGERDDGGNVRHGARRS